jgi:hypothetical protein
MQLFPALGIRVPNVVKQEHGMTSRLIVVALVVVGGSVSPGGVARGFDRSGDGAFSASVGGLTYLADEDSRDGASPRLAFGGYAEYSPSSSWAFRFESGVGWVGYAEDKSPAGADIRGPKPVKVVSPTTLTLVRRLNASSERFLYLGAGLGIYYWEFKISGKEQRDPETFEKVASGKIGSFDPGLNGLVGYEYPLSPSVALLGEAQLHYVFSANTTDRPDKSDPDLEDFPVFNGNDMFVQGRLGVKVYFDLIRFEEPAEEF